MSSVQDTDARGETEEREEAAARVKELEDDPPTDLSQWPSDKGKYLTFGGPEGDHGYEEGPTRELGASEVRHHEDGSVPTDPNSPDIVGASKEDEKGSGSGGGDDDDDTDEKPGPGSQNGRQADDDDNDDKGE